MGNTDSNLTSFLNATGNADLANRSSVITIGSALGAAADIASGVGIAIGAVEWVSQLAASASPSELELTVRAIEEELRTFETLLFAAEGVAQINLMRNFVGIELTMPLGYFKTLEDDPTADLGNPDTVIANCLGPLNVLAGGAGTSYWEIPRDFVVHFKPAHPWRYSGEGWSRLGLTFDTSLLWGGAQLRFVSVDPELGQVFTPAPLESFNYRYILPAFLWAIYLVLAVGRSVRLDFIRRHAGAIRAAVGVLREKYERVRDGIVCVAAPGPDDLIPVTVNYMVREDPAGALVVRSNTAPDYLGVSCWDTPALQPGLGVDRAMWAAAFFPSLFARPYGALQIDSGYAGDPASGTNTVREYPDPRLSLPAGYGVGLRKRFPPRHDEPEAFPPLGWYDHFYSVYLLRTLRLYRRVYRDLGLPAVVSAMNSLCAMLDDYTPLGGGPVLDCGSSSMADALRVIRWRERRFYSLDFALNETAFTAASLRQLWGYVVASTGVLVAPLSLRWVLQGS